MSLIQITDLSFSYTGALEPVLSGVNLELDTRWRLGLIGRNGRGKTTFLKLLAGQLKGSGSITAAESFEYFPQTLPDDGRTALQAGRNIIAPLSRWEARMRELEAAGDEEAMREYGELENRFAAAGGYDADERLAAELGRLEVDTGVLERPYESLSGGEKVKLQLAALFLKKHSFLLIDEPTDHLDTLGRQTVARWLRGKQGFIVVSHDRAFLDEAVSHILSINRADIELQRGNYSSWQENRRRRDEFEKAENRKLEGSISRLKEAARRTGRWSDQIEKSKSGNGTASYNKGPASLDRGYVGHQAARMMQRSKAIEKRRQRELEEKEQLLKNLEETPPLRFHILPAGKKCLLEAENLSLCYGGGRPLFQGLNFQLEQGERVALCGGNGSGKTSLLKILLGQLPPSGGVVRRQSGLVISSLPQDTAFLKGPLRGFAQSRGLDESLFLALLRKLDFSREAFAQNMESYSAGQKKKVCLAVSLACPAHLFIWDEPLNYIDLPSREQVEAAVLESAPSLLFVEHDLRFSEKTATRRLVL